MLQKTPDKLPKTLLRSIAKYLKENFIDTCKVKTYVAEDRFCREEAMFIGSVPQMAPVATCKAKTLEEALQAEDMGFSEALLKLIDKSGKKDAEIYKKASLSKQHFSKIRNNPNYKPTKPTAIALALALELDLEETKELIGRAGYALTNSSKFDLIIRYFIEQGNYNVVEINMALYEFDQTLLGV